MLLNETQTRVRFGETDKMNYVYYGNYPLYYEMGRTEMLRELGISYRKMEEMGTMLPVLDLYVKYIKSAHYDDLLTIKTTLKEYPNARIRFDYEIYNSEKDLINMGYTTLVFVDANTYKPCRPPQYFLDIIDPYFKK